MPALQVFRSSIPQLAPAVRVPHAACRTHTHPSRARLSNCQTDRTSLGHVWRPARILTRPPHDTLFAVAQPYANRANEHMGPGQYTGKCVIRHRRACAGIGALGRGRGGGERQPWPTTRACRSPLGFGEDARGGVITNNSRWSDVGEYDGPLSRCVALFFSPIACRHAVSSLLPAPRPRVSDSSARAPRTTRDRLCFLPCRLPTLAVQI